MSRIRLKKVDQISRKTVSDARDGFLRHCQLKNLAPHTYTYDYPQFHLSMDCFFATVIEGDLVLKEHEAAKWLRRTELDTVNWLPADQGIIQLLKELHTEGDECDEP